MSVFLYYSISEGLTKDNIIEIDKKVTKNQQTVYRFIRKTYFWKN